VHCRKIGDGAVIANLAAEVGSHAFGMRPVFSGVPTRTPEQALTSHGPGERQLDAVKGVAIVSWHKRCCKPVAGAPRPVSLSPDFSPRKRRRDAGIINDDGHRPISAAEKR
jgi:hypothetical protein